MGSAVWVLLTLAATLMLTLCWTEHFDLWAWVLDVLVALISLFFLAFLGTVYCTAVWKNLGKPVFGAPSRWRLTTWLAWFVVVSTFCLAFVLHSQHLPLAHLPENPSFVIPPEWNVREPVLLARVETQSPLTPWLGAGFHKVRNGANDDFLAPSFLYTPRADSSGSQQRDALVLAPTVVSSAWKELSLVFATLPGSVDSVFGFPSATLVAQIITTVSDRPGCCKADRSAEEHRVPSLAPVSTQFTIEPSLAMLDQNFKLTVHVVMCAPSDQILVCLSSLHFASAQLQLQQEAHASGQAELAFHVLDTSIRRAQASYAASCLLLRRQAAVVTRFLQSTLSPSTLHQSSVLEQLSLSHRNLAVGSSIYLHRDQLHGLSADFLWSQTTELASAALPAQPSVLRAFGANTPAIQEDMTCVAKSNSTRDTADLNSGVYLDLTTTAPYSTAAVVAAPVAATMHPLPPLALPALDFIKRTSTPLLQISYESINTTCDGLPITVQQEPRHQHNGTSTGSIVWDNSNNNVSWPVTFIISGLGLDTIVAALLTMELCMIEGTSSEVPQLTCHLHYGVPRATTFLLDGTAAKVQTALHGSDLWAGSFLAGPEAILRLPSADLFMSEGFHYISVPRLTSHMHNGTPLAVHPNLIWLMLLPLPDSMPRNRTTIEGVNVKRAPFALGSLPTSIYTNVQGWIRHMHSDTPRTILFTHINTTITNGTYLGNCNQMMPSSVNTLAAPHGMCAILHDCTHLWMHVVFKTTAMPLHPDALQQQLLPTTAMHELQQEEATLALWVVALFISFSLHIALLVLQKSGRVSRLLGPQVDWTTGVYRGTEIGTTRRVLNVPAKLQKKMKDHGVRDPAAICLMLDLLSKNQGLPVATYTEASFPLPAGAPHMAIEIYRMYMDERLLAQLDWGACLVYFEILLGDKSMEEPVCDAFDLAHCMSGATLSESEKAWFYSTPWGRAKLTCPPIFEPTVVDVLRREAEQNYLGMKGGKPADCEALRSSPSQLSDWCGQRADLIMKGSMYR